MSASHGLETAVVAILAGGRGRRLPRGKPIAPLHGRPLLAHPLAAALATGLDTVIVAKRDSLLPPLPPGCELLIEPAEPIHPLSGIVTALKRFERPIVAVGCDMPFLSAETIAWLASLAGPAVVTVRGEPQPLLALWTPAQLPTLERALRRCLPLRATIDGLPHGLAPRRIDEDALSPFGDAEALCFNVNDPEDLERAEAMLAKGGS